MPCKRKKKTQKLWNLLSQKCFGVSFVSFCFTIIFNVEYCMEFLLISVRREGLVRTLFQIRKLPCHWLWLRLGGHSFYCIQTFSLNYPGQQLSWQNHPRREYGEFLKELPDSSGSHVPEQSQFALQGHTVLLDSWKPWSCKAVGPALSVLQKHIPGWPLVF